MQTQLHYTLCFHTPAFLGNASQQAQWRTPPIKALLRQWWRVAVAKELGYDVARLRQREAALFGVAADEGDSRKSAIRIRLGHWDMGQLKDWPRHGTVKHREVPAPVGSDLYLGFGPLEYDKASRSTALKNNAALQVGSNASLSLAFPEAEAPALLQALWLMDRFGTLGGRSRNGWGSFSLNANDEKTAGVIAAVSTAPLRHWQEALKLDWPHALGSDARGPLVWQTRPFDSWPQLMQELARLKIGLRTQFTFNTGKDAPHTEDRHWLAYPVTNHSVKAWGGNARLPNTLRFKIRPAPENPQQIIGVIFHVPCLPPPAFRPDVQAITAVWKKVHDFLDSPAQSLTRIPA